MLRLSPLRAGRGRLNPIEEAELGPVDEVRILHLQLVRTLQACIDGRIGPGCHLLFH
jgi:hypothetical protein